MNDGIGSTRELFDSEAAAFKTIIYDMINVGNLDVAKQLLSQYTLINQTDPEIDIIRKMLSLESETACDAQSVSDEFAVLRDIETIFVLNRIVFGRVGLHDSVFRKVKMMEDAWNYNPLILMCNHNVDQRQGLMLLQTADAGTVTLSANTRILNVYDHFQKSYAEGLENNAVYRKSDDGMRYELVEGRDNEYDVYDGDTLVRQEHFTGYAGSLRMVCNFENDKKVNELIYDDWGYLNCVREFDSGDETIYKEKYYTTDGNVCIDAVYEHEDKEKSNPKKLIVYDEAGNIIKDCANTPELVALCLEQIIPDDKFCIVVIEEGLMSQAATEIDTDKSKRAICQVIHSTFRSDPYKSNSVPQKYYKYLCENNSRFDGIILLTKSAKRDFERQYGKKDSLFVIPHPYPYKIDKADFDLRDPKKVVAIARLDPVKQLDKAIYIFSLVVKKLPDAILEIYGRGPEAELLDFQIKKLGMEEHVFLKGHTDDPISAMQTASMFMMTSVAEGLGLTLLESISNGLPAFAFDIKYGPSEVIDDGKTGFLIPRFNAELYANKMIKYLGDIDMQRTMSKNCYEAAPKFNFSQYIEKWYDMTATLYNRRNMR